MNTITKNQRYLPHEIQTRFHACKLYATKQYSVAFIIRRYKISKASLMRWMKRFDGTKESLVSGSHKPLSPHPKAHTEEEIAWINNYLRRSPYLSMIELYTKLRLNRGYSRHPASLFRFLRKQGYYTQPSQKKLKYKPKPYDTPEKLGEKWQMDVKFVPQKCKANNLLATQKFYQYTVIDEASRERFLYHYDEYSSYTTCDFIKRSINYFSYLPKIIQTDNGPEFTHTAKTERKHPMDLLCEELGIKHQLIRPRTPRHNGKVERSHRTDNQRFYLNLKFYSLEDLRKQAKQYLYRSNRTAMTTLNYLTPIEKRIELFAQFS